jgi:hypothetical protein
MMMSEFITKLYSGNKPIKLCIVLIVAGSEVSLFEGATRESIRSLDFLDEDRFAWALDELELDGAQIDAMTDRRDGYCRRTPDGIIGSHESSNPHYCWIVRFIHSIFHHQLFTKGRLTILPVLLVGYNKYNL